MADQHFHFRPLTRFLKSNLLSVQIYGCILVLVETYLPAIPERDDTSCVEEGEAPIQDLATSSNSLSISGAQRVKALLQKLYRGFLINSMNVMSKPH